MELWEYKRLPKNEGFKAEVKYSELTEIRKQDVDIQSMNMLNYLEGAGEELNLYDKEVTTYTHAYNDDYEIIKEEIDDGTESWSDLFDIREVYEIVTKNFHLCHYDDCEHTLETYELHLKECCTREFPDTMVENHHSIIKWFSDRGVDYEKYVNKKREQTKSAIGGN